MAVNRVRVTGMDLDDLRAYILTKPDQVTAEIADQLQEVGAEAVRDMRDTIENSTTKTGAQAMRSGQRGTAGRVRGRDEAATSGRPRVGGKSMRDRVDFNVKVNKRSISLRFGWLDGRPGYAFFQEYGTKNGVKAMHAFTNARANAEVKIKAILGKY